MHSLPCDTELPAGLLQGVAAAVAPHFPIPLLSRVIAPPALHRLQTRSFPQQTPPDRPEGSQALSPVPWLPPLNVLNSSLNRRETPVTVADCHIFHPISHITCCQQVHFRFSLTLWLYHPPNAGGGSAINGWLPGSAGGARHHPTRSCQGNHFALIIASPTGSASGSSSRSNSGDCPHRATGGNT